ncbi:hypothetical protein LX15_002805 [Streptoalloteichus tenebrarius]|uniref:Uncharacterized protein n=1 Tax=Streptoalloteichus tenebrarius (strain ATCC 17920 / DSM 40477 / JCM 4838 / CBS 697.72 / NBRC 16177 / NCIMB 11028 / NRRL B-12390 / A12253. 1 / ISP 5477) TaxID=1933 RepID=A0ABT1HUB2_STRSD|nr:hypothetical protein [Streptoalloteichus tenebrarius]MCP2259104.1 hypothetical protein [Streptoalloteichus tenebrarius]BFE99570.1 hypothetical protein GCM10020241_12460 [Streptoalloteichus tenebrarius]
MRVLVTEAAFGDSDEVVRRLRSLGCRVSTCHGSTGFCRALSPGGRCPLDTPGEPVDLVVDVRAGDEELTTREYGAVCAVRARRPLVVVPADRDVPVRAPAAVRSWAAEASLPQLLDACARRHAVAAS